MLTLEIQRLSMSLERGLELQSCPWEGVSWTEEGFEQSLWSVLRAVMSTLVCGAEENVFAG